jgi:hypothetical protein
VPQYFPSMVKNLLDLNFFSEIRKYTQYVINIGLYRSDIWLPLLKNFAENPQRTFLLRGSKAGGPTS